MNVVGVILILGVGALAVYFAVTLVKDIIAKRKNKHDGSK